MGGIRNVQCKGCRRVVPVPLDAIRAGDEVFCKECKTQVWPIPRRPCGGCGHRKR